MSTYILELLSGLIVLMLILPFHEFAHAWTANKLGDTTAEEQGRLTINPMAHIDILGGICLVLCGFGWAKPVPVNPYRFKPMRTEYVTTKSGKQKLKKTGISMRAGMAITAAAGPISNVIAAFVTIILFRIAEVFLFKDVNATFMWLIDSGLIPSDEMLQKYFYILYVLYFIAIININLAVFNLIPIPPLDGSKILGYFLGRKFEGWMYANQQKLSMIFMIIILASNFMPAISNVVFAPLTWLSGIIFDGLWFITGWVPALVG